MECNKSFVHCLHFLGDDAPSPPGRAGDTRVVSVVVVVVVAAAAACCLLLVACCLLLVACCLLLVACCARARQNVYIYVYIRGFRLNLARAPKLWRFQENTAIYDVFLACCSPKGRYLQVFLVIPQTIRFNKNAKRVVLPNGFETAVAIQAPKKVFKQNA